MDGYIRVAEIQKAMAHPIRLQILRALSAEGEACVCHLENLLGVRQAALSQQLAKLRDGGLVKDQREGTNVYYSLRDVSLAQFIEILFTTAQLLAMSEGTTLEFELPVADASTPCRCPRCNSPAQ
jgi:ArsR family transcriptional regulator